MCVNDESNLGRILLRHTELETNDYVASPFISQNVRFGRLDPRMLSRTTSRSSAALEFVMSRQTLLTLIRLQYEPARQSYTIAGP
ncbi:MAG: hypothetical protein WBD95_05675 [Xanthobacteraceae bacterium]